MPRVLAIDPLCSSHDPSVCNEDVQAPELGGSRVDHCLLIIIIANVAGDRQRDLATVF